MARFMLSVFGPTHRGPYGVYASKEDMLEAFAATGAFNNRLQAAGQLVFADGLAEASTAITVDGQGDQPVVSEKPYLPGDEQLGGFWVIEADDRDQAQALAAEASAACRGVIEVRPFHTSDDINDMLNA